MKSRMDDDMRDDDAGTVVLQRADYIAVAAVAENVEIVMAEQNPRSWESFGEVRMRVHDVWLSRRLHGHWCAWAGVSIEVTKVAVGTDRPAFSPDSLPMPRGHSWARATLEVHLRTLPFDDRPPDLEFHPRIWTATLQGMKTIDRCSFSKTAVWHEVALVDSGLAMKVVESRD